MAARSRAVSLMTSVGAASCSCPAHSTAFSGPLRLHRGTAAGPPSPASTDYAFEMACSNIRYGPGVTAEVGQDMASMGVKKLGVFTDPVLAALPPVRAVLDSLTKHGVAFTLYDQVRKREGCRLPSVSLSACRCGWNPRTRVSRRRRTGPSGSGSTLSWRWAAGASSTLQKRQIYTGRSSETNRANVACFPIFYSVSLYHSSDPEAEFLDYVNAPIGQGKPVTCALKPLVAVPTTAGTGSETTGVAVFDYEPLQVKSTLNCCQMLCWRLNLQAKTGIASRSLRPLLGIVDPLHTLHMPEMVAAYSGFDVLCHALESFTAISYLERSPRPSSPVLRPAYQGSNPISDIWARHSLDTIRRYFIRAVKDAGDLEARSQMHLARSVVQ